jgi:hypothetical protein
VADGCGCVVVVAPDAIDSSADHVIALPHLVEQPATAGPIRQLRGHTGYAVIGDHLVDFETRRLGMRPLMLDCLARVRNASV